MKKRDDFTDSEIMDALEAEGMHVARAAGRLGIGINTLYTWLANDPNLKKFRSWRTQHDAVSARDKLKDILERADELDPRQMGHVINICKILLDKAEADKTEAKIDVNGGINQELEDKLKKLLGD